MNLKSLCATGLPRWPGRPAAPWVPAAPGLPFGHRLRTENTDNTNGEAYAGHPLADAWSHETIRKRKCFANSWQASRSVLAHHMSPSANCRSGSAFTFAKRNPFANSYNSLSELLSTRHTYSQTLLQIHWRIN